MNHIPELTLKPIAMLQILPASSSASSTFWEFRMPVCENYFQNTSLVWSDEISKSAIEIIDVQFSSCSNRLDDTNFKVQWIVWSISLNFAQFKVILTHWIVKRVLNNRIGSESFKSSWKWNDCKVLNDLFYFLNSSIKFTFLSNSLRFA